MSACLFTLKSETIQNMTDEELKNAIAEWNEHQKNVTPGNRFEADRCLGAYFNLQHANAEKYRRDLVPHRSTEEMIIRLNIAGLNYEPALLQAFIDAYVYGEGSLKITPTMKVVHVPYVKT